LSEIFEMARNPDEPEIEEFPVKAPKAISPPNVKPTSFAD